MSVVHHHPPSRSTPLLRDHEKIESRIYPRQRGGPIRYYGDFRDCHDIGGGLDPLTAPGERYATTNLDHAKTLAAARVAQLEALRKACPTGDAADGKPCNNTIVGASAGPASR